MVFWRVFLNVFWRVFLNVFLGGSFFLIMFSGFMVTPRGCVMILKGVGVL